MFGEMPLLFAYFEACHYNSSFPTKIPLNTYGHSLGPAAGVYEDVYFISPITDTRAPHVIPREKDNGHEGANSHNSIDRKVRILQGVVKLLGTYAIALRWKNRCGV